MFTNKNLFSNACKLVLCTVLLSTLFSCKEENKQITKQEQKKVITDTIETIRIVKTIKEVNETHTGYTYEYDWLNGKFRHQPTINSKMKYFIVFTNGDIEETTKEKGMFHDKGDTIKTYRYVYSK
jgi:hypothetical protein